MGTLDIVLHELASEIRVLAADVLKVSAVERHARDVEAWAENNVGALREKFFAERLAVPQDDGLVPRLRHRQERRELRRCAWARIVAETLREAVTRVAVEIASAMHGSASARKHGVPCNATHWNGSDRNTCGPSFMLSGGMPRRVFAGTLPT